LSGKVYSGGVLFTGTGNGTVGQNGKIYSNGVLFSGTGDGTAGTTSGLVYSNGVIANGILSGDLFYVNGVLIPACAGDCYLEGLAPDYAQGLSVGTIRRGPFYAVMVLQQSGAGFKYWAEQNGDRVLNASGYAANGWQKGLTRAGTEFGGDLTSSSVISQIEGRVCPGTTSGAGVFVNFDNMIDGTRCLYYDSGNSRQRLDAAHPDLGGASGNLEGEDWLRSWTRASTRRGTGSSYYEGNIKTCADKGMRLPTAYETKMNAPSSPPTGDGITPTWPGSNGVPPVAGNGWTATASANAVSTDRYWQWSNLQATPQSQNYYVVSNFGFTYNNIRCVLPSH
ncbi:MAG: hypothetical protein EBZ49_13230, partial [Proteobacteria bacterium]|nr:hypothetical protein [Pseudomonadota bacterium]